MPLWTPLTRSALLLLALALPACSNQSLDTLLQNDYANYQRASERLAAAKSAGDEAAISAEAKTYKVALEQLRYDRDDWPDPNGGHGAGGGHGHPH